MKIVEIGIDDIKPYENNPRHNDSAIEYVANSIKEFGFKQPIVIDKDNVIIAGHTRWKASKRLGLEKVPCLYADDLTEDQVKAYRLADNKVGELSTWDDKLLDIEIPEIELDMEQFGFIEFDEEEDDEDKGEPEVEFTSSLGEEHNYLVLYFENDVDWLQALSLFDVKTVKNLAKAKNGKITSGSQQMGVGRVLNGPKALDRLVGAGDED